ncbi:HAD family phosphatase [Paenibacillus oralis]|uniref:HAD family phosphatase n=1 Tax=Paenibacillus oralis TaxID=2490856 RepID=A0A3P3U723_9BACL|nr:Cof-type HAD-IIB family hydrolase [Paenibacillus oralis]RRJ64303.1 HAD family phosphatase [Paenibacillus oralis]
MKLIAVDLDGTLLTSESKPSAEGLDAIRQAAAKGHTVTLCTGRASFDAKGLTGDLAIPIIGFNGAAVYDERGLLLRETPIAEATALDAVRYLLEQQVYFEIFCPEAIYSPCGGERKLQAEMDVLVSANPAASRERLWKSVQIQFIQFGFQQIEDPLQLLERGATVYKLLIFTFDEAKLNRIRKHFGEQDHLHTTSSADHTLEIISTETDKGSALRFMAEHLGVPMADTVVLGDSYNDISMFHVAGTSIAMGNAVDEIKQLSTMVTRDNNHHGVAYALNHLLEL